MKLLFLDFETQGDQPTEHLPTEVGMTLVDVEGGLTKREQTVSQFIWEPHYPPQTPEIVEITGITDEMLRAEGRSQREVFQEMIFPMVRAADFVLAHNKQFDKTVYDATSAREALEPASPVKQWLCTIQDVPYAKKYKCKKLSHLAYDHGVVVDPSTLHRAGADTDLLARLITTKYKIEDIIAYANTPWVYLRAVVPPPWEDGGVGTGQAKKLGYGWEKIWGTEVTFPKRWVRRIKETELEAEKARCPFKLMRLTLET